MLLAATLLRARAAGVAAGAVRSGCKTKATLLRALATTPSSGTGATPGTGTNMPVWPPPRSQLAKMYEDEEADFVQNQAHAGHTEEYLDDHHYVPEGGPSDASLSPHHEGYEVDPLARQRMDQVFKHRYDQVKGAGASRAVVVEGPGHDTGDDELDWGAKMAQRREQRDAAMHLREGEDKQLDIDVPAAMAASAHSSSSEDDDDDNTKAAGGARGGGGGASGGSVGGGGGGTSWSWAKPQEQRKAARRFVEIPVLPRTLLASAEVVAAMEALGGMDVQVVDVAGKGNLDAEAMVFVSGRSGAHLRRMADTLVQALKQRGITEREAPGVTGAEGYDCDDWMIVDAGNLIIHLMEPRQRKALGLEAYWGDPNFTGVTMPLTNSDAAWEAEHDRVLEANPPDDDYDPLRDDHAANERAFRRLIHGKAGGGTVRARSARASGGIGGGGGGRIGRK